jgi:hypothetical protein
VNGFSVTRNPNWSISQISLSVGLFTLNFDRHFVTSEEEFEELAKAPRRRILFIHPTRISLSNVSAGETLKGIEEKEARGEIDYLLTFSNGSSMEVTAQRAIEIAY